MNQFGFVQTVDGFGQCIVVAVALATESALNNAQADDLMN